MQKYLLRSLIAIIPLIIGVTFISFLIMNMAPGDPTSIYIDPTIGEITPEMLEIIRADLGLDRPFFLRYFYWLSTTIRGDLGYSFVSNRPVTTEIGARIFNTLLLTVSSLLVALTGGVFIGVYAAINQYKTSDYILSILAFVGISMPNFWLGMMLILLFTSRLGWLPSVGMSSFISPPTLGGQILDVIKHMILPVIVLSSASLASWTRYQRSAMLEVIRQDYIRTARSKGLAEKTVIYRHALRNASLPIVTLLGMSMPILISGSFIVETIFSWPGMGRLGVNAIFSRDYPIVMGVTLFSSFLVLLGNLLADIFYAVLDPRIRYD